MRPLRSALGTDCRRAFHAPIRAHAGEKIGTEKASEKEKIISRHSGLEPESIFFLKHLPRRWIDRRLVRDGCRIESGMTV
jgi:hypothetical protein